MRFDSIAHMRHMGMLFEANVCGGTLMASGMGLFENFCYPEARALYSSIMSYMNSQAFAPKKEPDKRRSLPQCSDELMTNIKT